MNALDARRYLERMTQWDAKPVLTSAEIDDLLTIAAQDDPYGNGPELFGVWKPSFNYTVGDLVVPTVFNGYVYKATADAGTSNGSEPTWPTVLAATVADDDITWTADRYTYWEPTWNLPLAAAEGWDWKAAKVVAQYDVQAGSVEAMRSQIWKHCIAQRDRFRGMANSGSSVGWIEVNTRGYE
jgi:hypothetical protein